MATSNSRPSMVPRAPLVVVTVAALAAAIPAALLAGAVTAPVAGLPDPGALVRWGVVLVRAIHDLAAALTVGLLVLAAFVVPEDTSTSRRVTAMRWAAASGVVSVVALLPLALAGHASGAADHDTAVNSLGAHLVGAALWVGGLMALVVLRPVLDRALGVSVARYSTMAGWCFVTVAVSGVLNAALRVGSFAGLATSYGVLVLLKATALVILGVVGWRQRTVVVGRLAADPLAGRAFARLAVLELAVMGAAFGLATALSRSAPPVPQAAQGDVTPVQSLTGYPPPPLLTSASWFTVWRVEWLWLSVAVVAVGLYVAGIVRLRRRGDSWSPLRAISWTLGWVTFVYATSGAPNVYGRVLFSA